MYLFDLLTAILSAILFFYCVRSKQVRGGRFIVYLVFFILYVFPLYIDLSYEIPSYDVNVLGYLISSKDLTTRFIYNIVILVSQIIIVKWHIKSSDTTTYVKDIALKPYYSYLNIGMALPLVAFIIYGQDMAMLIIPFWRELGLFNLSEEYDYLERLSYVGITSSCLLLLRGDKTKLSIYRLLPLAFLYMNICIQGKRAILFFAIVNIILIVFHNLNDILFDSKTKWLKNVIGSIIGVALTILMLVVTINVKVENRNYDETNAAELITTTRMDFLRDDRVRLAIFSEMNEEEWPMLNYFGETIVYNIMSTPPINIFFNILKIKYYTYQQFLTSCLTHSQFNPENNFMTPSFFAELISNLGIILGVLAMCWLCVFVGIQYNKYPYPLNFLVLCSFLLLNLFSFRYVIFYLEFSFIICLLYKHRKNSNNFKLS